MTAIVREQHQSRGIDTQQGRPRGVRRFHVYDDGTGTAITTPKQVIQLFGQATSPAAVPNFGFVFDDTVTDLYAIDYALDLVEGQKDLWELQWFYQDFLIQPGAFPTDIGYVEWNFNQRREFDEFWRVAGGEPAFVIPANGDPVPGVPIAGLAIDSAGEPGSRLRLQQVLEISEVVEGPIWPRLAIYRQAVGKRNRNAIWGAPSGQLLYEGTQSRRVELNRFAITHRVICDEFFHLKQQPARDQDGKVIIWELEPTDPFANTAKFVQWIQPFPGKYEFASLSENF